jgi:hypothetical protein
MRLSFGTTQRVDRAGPFVVPALGCVPVPVVALPAVAVPVVVVAGVLVVVVPVPVPVVGAGIGPTAFEPAGALPAASLAVTTQLSRWLMSLDVTV